MRALALISLALGLSACASTADEPIHVNSHIDPLVVFSDLAFDSSDSFHIGKVKHTNDVAMHSSHLIMNDTMTTIVTETTEFVARGFCADVGVQNYLFAVRTFEEPYYGVKDIWAKGEPLGNKVIRRCKPVNPHTSLMPGI